MSVQRRSSIRVGAVFAIAAVASLCTSSSVLAAPCWRPPVDAPVSDPYRAPTCPWCRGNRGIEFDTEPGDLVTSIVAGRVSYAGVIAGVRYVVVEIANGWRVTYGNLAHSDLGHGDMVVAGLIFGAANGPFHLGLREGDEYLDPTPYLGESIVPVRLVPTDGLSPRPSTSTVIRCGGLASPHPTDFVAREPSLRR